MLPPVLPPPRGEERPSGVAGLRTAPGRTLFPVPIMTDPTWNPQVPLPRNWPYPTHVVEVLSGSTLPWLAANGGYENYVANRWGCGSWVLREVAHNARSISEISVIVPSRPPRRLPERAEPPAPKPPSDPDRISNAEWAKCWASSFIQKLVEESPDTDAVRVYRLVVEELEANADLVRGQSFDLQSALTDSVVRRAALAAQAIHRSDATRFSRRLRSSLAGPPSTSKSS